MLYDEIFDEWNDSMFGLGKKKIDKAAWAEAVYGQKLKHPEKDLEDQLSALTTVLLMQHHRIIMDSVRLVHTTKTQIPVQAESSSVTSTIRRCLN